MKILSIGNSFSQDAQRYLYRLAKHDGVELETTNLFIGGCSLQRHYNNMLDDNADYDLEVNGERTGTKISIKQALVSDTWDFITLQQASHFSVHIETYSPYIEALAENIRSCCPKSKLLLHQTWAYEDNSEKLEALSEFASAKEMFSAICASYSKAAQNINADGIIPCGQAMLRAVESGVKIHRDTFHASFGAGRYLLALCWYKALTKKDISHNTFNEFDEPVTDAEKNIIIKAVNSVF